jgi:hypothetical protein
MDFVPAGEIIGALHRVRTVSIVHGPGLPDGEYRFIDMYCTDPSCDCRKTMILVVHEDKLVTIINYGWESPAFYRKWMGSLEDDDAMPQMHGASVDLTSPDLVSPDSVLALFNALLNDTWIASFKRNYKAVKAAVSGAPN